MDAVGVRGCGWRGEGGGGRDPLPQPGPGPPADSAPRRPLPRPGLTVREAAPEEAAGEGTAAGALRRGCGSGRRLPGGGS